MFNVLLDLKKLLFIDIETAPKYPSFEEFSEKEPELADIWLKKKHDEKTELSLSEYYINNAGLHAEFSRVICISLSTELNGEFKTKSYSQDDEKELLISFRKGLEQLILSYNKNYVLCGHNIIGFDIPFLAKRYIINGLYIPSLINTYGKKPWEVNSVDTMQIFKFTSMGYTSLDLMVTACGIKSSKTNDIDGSKVGLLYHEDKDKNLPLIVKYCEDDTKVVYEFIKLLINLE